MTEDYRLEFAEDLVGVPDPFRRFWTPHRMAYIGGENKPRGDRPEDGCPFCVAPQRSDEDALIVYRGEKVFALMNLFPYNSGHMLICPYRHISEYIELDQDERAEFGEVTARAIRTLKKVANPAGFNLGMNQGEVAGAGIAGHLHQHIVPRWAGDANFFPLIARTKAVPQLLGQAREQIAKGWQE
ncbi:MAG: HIT domain-containing protein [Cutibacterium avidum]|nr:HIT domain-containing protein [Cutibacterium avidum]